MNFKLLRTHYLQPLRNIIHVNRMKPYVHRQLVPPEPDDYEDLKDDQPVHETELHPLDQGKLQEPAGEDQLEEKNETQIDVVNLDGEIPADIQTNSERPQSSEDHQNPPKRVTRIQTKDRKQDRSKDEDIPLRRSTRIRKYNANPECLVGNDLDEHTLSEEPEYEIEKIIRGKMIDNELHYLVKWKGFSMKDASFVSHKDLNDTAK